MKQGILELLDNLSLDDFDIYNVREKSGSRIEYSLHLNDELYRLARQISDVPLRFASIIRANPFGQDQDFHFDSSTGERAIIYLTDVENASNGPIEFKDHGKILGKKGTFVHYSAYEIHRGCKSNIERYALALAFNDVQETITTIGGTDCELFVCPTGYKTKNPVPPYGPEYQNDTQRRDYCCTIDDNNITNSSNFVWIIVLIVIILYFFK